jgi:hypothetical protein
MSATKTLQAKLRFVFRPWCLAALVFGSPASHGVVTEQTLAYPDFGTVNLVRPDEPPKGLVLSLSDAGGWDAAMKATAAAVAERGYLVAGLATPALCVNGCSPRGRVSPIVPIGTGFW